MFRTLFLLDAVNGDEFTPAIVTLNLAREAGIERVVYLSVFEADRAVNVPHFAVKYGAERKLEAMEQLDLAAAAYTLASADGCRAALRDIHLFFHDLLGYISHGNVVVASRFQRFEMMVPRGELRFR